MTEANFSGKKLGAAGAIIVSAWLSRGKDKRAMTLLNISDNGIGQPAKESSRIKKAACEGISFKVGAFVEYHGKQCKVTKAVDGDGELRVLIPADMSGIIAIANTIKDMGALLELDISNNDLSDNCAEALVSGLAANRYVGRRVFFRNHGIHSAHLPCCATLLLSPPTVH
jgi:hypothetical protein